MHRQIVFPVMLIMFTKGQQEPAMDVIVLIMIKRRFQIIRMQDFLPLAITVINLRILIGTERSSIIRPSIHLLEGMPQLIALLVTKAECIKVHLVIVMDVTAQTMKQLEIRIIVKMVFQQIASRVTNKLIRVGEPEPALITVQYFRLRGVMRLHYVRHVIRTVFIKELRAIVTGVIDRIMKQQEYRTIVNRDFPPIAKAVTIFLMQIGIGQI